ncbi:MAG TPA: BatA domain-containing protein, partial [Chitinispirillaceae bacterium]|nr:BatA domain-containing protein [Chitinispirillaceae bacterium]
MSFKNPQFLFLFILWIPMVWLYIIREKKFRPTVQFSDLSSIIKIPCSPFIKARHSVLVLRLIGTGLLFVALARPQEGRSDEEVTTEGVDIVLVMDVSASMKALDFKPDNRLNVAKQRV